MDTAQKLSSLIQLQTVSAPAADAAQQKLHDAAFAAFDTALAQLFPRLHEVCEVSHDTAAQLPLQLLWRGADAELAPVVLMAHYDVVPAPSSDADPEPFSGAIRDGFVHGRGALDDKGPLVVLLEAAEQLAAAGFQPPRDILFALGSDEEVQGITAKNLATAWRETGQVPYLVIDEGGAVVDQPLPGLPVPAAMIGVGEKGIATFKLRLRGKGGHASAPTTPSTLGRMARAVTRLEKQHFPARAPHTLMQMLRLFAAQAPRQQRHLLQALTTHPKVTAAALAARGGESAALVRTTVAVTGFQAGVADNVIAPSAEVTVNCRIAPGSSVAATARYLKRVVADPQITITTVYGEEPTELASTASPQWQLVAETVAKVWPGTLAAPYIMLANTDSRHWHRFTPAVYRFAPLQMSVAQRESIHGVGEKVAVSALQEGVAFWKLLLRALPGAQSALSEHIDNAQK